MHAIEVGPHNPELVRRFLSNPVLAWTARFVTRDRGHPTPKMHIDIMDAVLRYQQAVVKAPRSFAKSVNVCFRLPLYLAYNFPRLLAMHEQGLNPPIFPHHDITIMAGTKRLACHWLGLIRREIETNALLADAYGPIVGRVRNQDELVTRYRHPETGIWQDGVRIVAMGRGQQQRGWHPTLLIADDLDDDEEVLSGERLERAKDWWDGAVMGMLDETHCQAFVIGTTVAEDTLLEHIVGMEGWHHERHAAYVLDEAGVPMEQEGCETWPSKWPHERLKERERAIGRKRFELEYLSIAEGHEAQLFQRAWFKQYSAESDAFRKLLRDEPVYTVVAVDPAISRRDGADYTAIVALSATYSEPLRIYVRVGATRQGHWSAMRTVTETFNAYDAANAQLVVIETNAYQAALGELFTQHMESRGRTVPVECVVAKLDKEARAAQVTPLVERGHVFVDFTDHASRSLVDQCVRFIPGRANEKKDLMDAFVYALRQVQQWYERRRSRARGVKTVLPREVAINPLTGLPTATRRMVYGEART